MCSQEACGKYLHILALPPLGICSVRLGDWHTNVPSNHVQELAAVATRSQIVFIQKRPVHDTAHDGRAGYENIYKEEERGRFTPLLEAPRERSDPITASAPTGQEGVRGTEAAGEGGGLGIYIFV